MTLPSVARHPTRVHIGAASDRIRVLHVVVDFDGREAAGRFVVEVGRRAQLETHLCTNRLVQDGDGEMTTVHEIGGRPATFPFTRWRRIRRLIESLDIDVVHLHGGVLLPIVARSPAFRRVSVVLSVYAWTKLAPRDLAAVLWQSRHQRKSSTSLLLSSLLPEKLVGRLLDGTRTHGVLTPDAALAWRLRKITTVPVYDAAGGTSSDVARAVFDRRRPTIAFAGRAEIARGVDTLIEAMPSVVERVPGAHLRLLVLPSDELDEIRRLVTSLGVDEHVTIETEAQPGLYRAFAECTIGVFPFKHDHATLAPPLTVVEAMSVGLPIVATPVACMRPVVVDDVNGVLIPRNDPAALADAIAWVLGDHPTWQRMSDAAIVTVRRAWTWDRAARATTDAYPRRAHV